MQYLITWKDLKKVFPLTFEILTLQNQRFKIFKEQYKSKSQNNHKTIAADVSRINMTIDISDYQIYQIKNKIITLLNTTIR